MSGTTTAPGYTLTFAAADPADVDRLGGKGAGLARMTQDGLRVPPGFVVSTAACRRYLEEDALPAGLATEMSAQLAALEEHTGKTFGAGPQPLLLSVRSGAPVSMPGMMDTVLNLGLGRAAAVALAASTGDPRFVADLVARFHAFYRETVLGALDPADGIDELVAAVGVDEDPGVVYDRIWAACEQALADDTGGSVPADPRAQLLGAVAAVFGSWNTRRARVYRDFHAIPHDLGTAVVVQMMVFGNLDADSGSGVVFTRNPLTGEPGLFGEYLAHSQGEDVVAGTRTPDPVATALALPLLHELRAKCAELERRQGDVLDIEFTVERSTLYFLQVRAAKRTPEAAVRIATDLLADGAITPAAALRAVSVEQVRQVQRPGFDVAELDAARAAGLLLTTGIGACPGQVSGALVLDPDRARAAAETDAAVVLARPVTSPADLHGMIAARGIVTATGGTTSHAAVVARALGTACVVGAAQLHVDLDARTITVGGRTLAEGADIALDGTTGEVFSGTFSTSTPAAAGAALSALLAVATTASGCAVFGRVTRPGDVATAVEAGATGLVVAVDDVLATTGHLDGPGAAATPPNTVGPGPVAELVAAAFTPLLAAAGSREVGVRATARQAAETGAPSLIRAQLDGLESAARNAGGDARVHLVAPPVPDPAHAAALRAERGHGAIEVGSYLDGSHDARALVGFAEAWPVVWLDGATLDRTAEGLQAALAAAAAAGCRVGVWLSGEVAPEVVTGLYAQGFRRFAVEAPETGPLVLALGRAASGPG